MIFHSVLKFTQLQVLPRGIRDALGNESSPVSCHIVLNRFSTIWDDGQSTDKYELIYYSVNISSEFHWTFAARDDNYFLINLLQHGV